MALMYRYFRTAMPLDYYTHDEVQTSPPPPGEQPPLKQDFFIVQAEEPLNFAPDEPDIRGFAVNTPTGDTIGTIHALIADTTNLVIPYAYVRIEGDRIVTVPTNQITMYPDLCLVTLEGGKTALYGAPDAKFDPSVDARNADRYWVDYRRQNAA